MYFISLERSFKVSDIPWGSRKRRQGLSRLRAWHNVALLLALAAPNSTSGQTSYCPEEWRDGVLWPETIAADATAGVVSSKPLCLAEDLSLVTRKCVTNGNSATWIPSEAPHCVLTRPSYDDADKCPPPFENVTLGPVCAHLGSPNSWDRAVSECFLSGTSRSLLDLDYGKFEAVLSYLRKQLWTTIEGGSPVTSQARTRTVWLDGRRNKALTPIVRKLPGDFQRMGVRWKELVNSTVEWAVGEPSFSPEKQCLVMDVPRFAPPTLRMESCFSRRPSVCVFVPPDDVKYPLLTRLACPDGYVTSLYRGEQHRCFRIVKSSEKVINTNRSPAGRCSASGDSLAMLSSAHINEFFIEMARSNALRESDKCLMGLSRNGKRFTWPGNLNVTFVNWAKDTNFTHGEIGVIRGDGRWDLVPCRETLFVDCAVCERPAQVPPRARMTLRLHPPSGRLLLSIYSGEGLWRYGGAEPVACFSDGYFGEARRLKLNSPVRDGRWSLYNLHGVQPDRHPGLNLTELHKTIFVLPQSGDVGRYWCEARRVFGLYPLTTDRVWNSNIRKGKFIFTLALEAIGACSGSHGIRDCEPTFGSKHFEVAVELRRTLKLPPGSIRPIRVMYITDGNLCLLLHVTVSAEHEEGMNESALEYSIYLRLISMVLAAVKSSNGKYEFVWLRSTRGCIQSYTRARGFSYQDELNWDACPLGYSAVSREICLQAPHGDIPVIRTCRGDYMFGGIWDPPSGVCSEEEPPKLTSDIHSLMLNARSGENASSVVRKAAELSSSPSKLSPADIHFLSLTMRAVAASASTLRAETDLGFVTSVADHILRANHTNVSMSQRLLNSTNVLLDALDDIFAEMVLGGDSVESQDGNLGHTTRIGDVYAAVTSQVAVQISDVSTSNNVTGVALVRKRFTSAYTLGHKSESDDSDENVSGFTHYSLLPLTSEQTLESLTDLQPEVAVLLPMEMLPGGQLYISDNNSIDGTSSRRSTRVVTTLFFSDLPFKPSEGGSMVSLDSDEDDDDDDDDEEEDDSSDDDEILGQQVNSHVISVWTSGLGPDLPAPVPILFRPLRPVGHDHSRHCAHWDFSASAWGGGWASDGCFFAGTMSNGMDVCICTHLTHFAELLFSHVHSEWDGPAPPSSVALDIISIVGCVLSLLGVAGIFTTAIVFRLWRHRLGTKILLHLTAAISLEMSMFIVLAAVEFTPEGDSPAWCLLFGCLLHYSIIATFCWMLVASALQYFRFVRILGDYRPPRFLLKASAFAWGLSFVPVILVLSIDDYPYGVQITSNGVSFNTTVSDMEENSAFCYPSGLSLILAVIFPVVCVIVANLSVYVLILRSILGPTITRNLGTTQIPSSISTNSASNVNNGSNSKQKSTSKGGEMQEKKFAVQHFRLAVLLFFLLGLCWLFGILAKIFRLSVFTYLFSATATLQGFVLFLFYVVGDPNTRQLWAVKLSNITIPWKGSTHRRKIFRFLCWRKSSTPSVEDSPSGYSSGTGLPQSWSSCKSSSLSE